MGKKVAGTVPTWCIMLLVALQSVSAIFAAPVPAPVARKGVGNYPSVPNAVGAMNALHLGWYYDWGTAPVGASPGIQFVPMIWGHADVNSKNLDAVKASGSGILLGFNEPNVKGQSNMTVAQAIADWPQLQATGLRLGSPATGTGDDNDPKGWLAQFMAQIKSHGYRVDFICIHPYQSNFDVSQATANLQKEIASVHAAYGLPIWVTEYGLVNWDTSSYPDAEAAARFASSSAALMDGLPYVERYAWYSLIPNQRTLSLTNADGSLNVIGRAWADAAGGVDRWRRNTQVKPRRASAIETLTFLAASCRAHTDLLPKQPATAPNYFCTGSAQNDMHGQGQPYHRLTALGERLVVLAEPAALAQPGERALHHPAARQHRKALMAIQLLHDLERDAVGGGDLRG